MPRGLGWVLFAILLVLKLAYVLDISWWWVFSPLWIPLIILGSVQLCVTTYRQFHEDC